MKQIRLRQLTLLNFKGVRTLTADFGEEATEVAGRNGSGKTTLFDAFTWVLFGKDSRDRKAFDIKTLDADGKAIPRLPHEVTAVLDVDGAQVTLTRRYTEKWTKRRGSATEEFTGHEEERLYNDVPCSLKEWNEKIAEICPEAIFKLITSPACFTSLKADAQRAMLLDMAGGFSDNEVIAASGQRQDFIALLGRLCGGKTMEEYKREVGAKKRRIKAELDTLPGRIDERKRDNDAYAATDYGQAEKELREKEQALAAVEAQLTQATARINQAYKAKQEISDRLAAAKGKMLKLAADTRTQMSKQHYAYCSRRTEIGYNVTALQGRIDKARQAVKDTEAEIADKTAQRNALIAEYRAINAETLALTAADFVCPTCGQSLDPANIEKKREQMTANFNAQKSEKLRVNKEKGLKCGKAVLEQLTASREAHLQDIANCEAEIARLNAELAQLPQTAMPTELEVEASVQSAPEYKALQGEIRQLEQELARGIDADADTAELSEARKMLADGITELKATLEGRRYIERNNERIAQLQEQVRTQSDLLAELEGMEFTMAEFAKARIAAVEGKINAMFSAVKFRMYETQVNGGEVETCEATVGGVPYSSLNSAMRINAGLDIINAISRHNGIAAPIFIDNCESVLEPMGTIGQQIRLIVADKELTIE